MTRNTILWFVGATMGLGILVRIALPEYSGSPTPATIGTTRARLVQVIQACVHYREEYGELPNTGENTVLADVLSGTNPKNIRFLPDDPQLLSKNGEIIDYWETPIRIIFGTNNSVQCISAGKDRQFNTSDDIERRH